jgi:Fe-S-cluster containining protein
MDTGTVSHAMDVDCEGCAGCCIDWRPLADTPSDHERGGPGDPLDDTYNLVPLTRDDVRAFLDAGLTDALRPRFWTVETGGVTVDGYRLAALNGRPVFYLGLRTPPKPVAPFDAEPRWLDTCVFLDPTTLQCRIHETDIYPAECETYPGHNLLLGAETECERVEAATDSKRLHDAEPPADIDTRPLGEGSIGHRLFAVPRVEILDGLVDAVATGTLTVRQLAPFVATAVASAPGTGEVEEDRYETALKRASTAGSWAGRAVERWETLATHSRPDPGHAEVVEEARGAPATPGWD